MTNGLVRRLFDGPVDVVGDVHGEIDALRDLLGHLGYHDDGTHPDGRHLVFLGDLTDRGPASLKVFNFVQGFVKDGLAQSILSNHDLNILLNRPKDGNGWFFDLDPAEQLRIRQFFLTLPLACEREDLRVVHACWAPAMIDVARRSSETMAFFQTHDRLIREADSRDTTLDEVQRRLNVQNYNPVKLLTSGPERRAREPFSDSYGRLRYEERVEWWLGYADSVWCVFGHYAIKPGRPHVFGQAVCIDYGVGNRYKDRLHGVTDFSKSTRLAAFRFPEKVIMFDDGTTASIEEES